MISDRCVYLHKLKGEIVYIGRGSIRRVKSKKSRSKSHLAVWSELEFVIHKDNLTHNEAVCMEQELLDAYFDKNKLFNKARKSTTTRLISFDKISEWLEYDESSPSCLRWLKRKGARALAGSAAGTSFGGYWSVKIDDFYLAHRLVMCLKLKEDLPVNCIIDHINRDRSCNLYSNLRIVTERENAQNRVHSGGALGIQNISYSERKERFTVHWRVNGVLSRVMFSHVKRTNRTKEEALELALAFRQKLVDDGIVIITKEPNAKTNP
jgi:HNH endonuclease